MLTSFDDSAISCGILNLFCHSLNEYSSSRYSLSFVRKSVTLKLLMS